MAPRGGGGGSGGGGGRAGGSTSSGSKGGSSSSSSSSSTSSTSGSKGGSSGSIPKPKSVSGAKGGSSSVSGSKGGSSSGSSSKGSKGPKAPKVPKAPKAPKGPKYNGGSSSTGNYYDPCGRSDGDSGTYVSAAIPSVKNPLSFLNLRSGRKPLVQHEVNTGASKEVASTGVQHYGRAVETTAKFNGTMVNSTSLCAAPTNYTLPAAWQGTIKEGDIAGYLGFFVFLVVFSILCGLLGRARQACQASRRAAGTVEGSEAAKETTSEESVPYATAPSLGSAKEMRCEKVSVAEDGPTDVTDSGSARRTPADLSAVLSRAAQYGWTTLYLLVGGLEVLLWMAVVLYLPRILAFLFPDLWC